ncbi:FtsK/SpoIIIE domain-containing protein [Actinomadura xylanilytica]|uniref:FtsK/SpoIIIE domain-containing protein n=1 Tax=Actinomadura xylanilytica TaxID=887459 RepID=UPI00255A73C2|nr:FtsK/SpoIIIE domain-containing protein [Actinomadura xylanilytica]MDL4776124.1 FtsK/SpoIIIE domain-containing protein [Actinomadura xylanilytica]
MRISFTALTGQGPRDVVINIDSEATVDGVAQSLFAALDGKGSAKRAATVPVPRFSKDSLPRDGRAGIAPRPARRALWLDGRMLDPQALAVKELRDGAVVAVEQRAAAATALAEPTGLVEVRVVSGPAAGPVHRLGLGATTLGSGPDVDVTLSDPAVPARSLRITVEPDGVKVEASALTIDSPTGRASLDGEPLTAKADWPLGGLVAVGGSVLALARSTAPDTHLEPLPEGGLAFNRPPRLSPPHRSRRLEVPKRPVRDPKERLRLFGALLFSAFGLVMAFGLGQWWWALFALAWPIMTVGEWVGDRMHGRKSYKKALKDYQRATAEFGGRLDRLRREDQDERRALHPDPAEVLLTATGPRRRLWERRLTDPDVLHLRLGLADLPARIELAGNDGDGAAGRGGGAERGGAGPIEIPRARQVPVALPLPELGVIGLTGPRPASRGLARWLVAQAAALHSPRDLAIVVLSADPEAGEAWNWVRWLPHCAPREGEECTALVGTDPESVAHRVTELAIRVTERRRAAQATASLFGQAKPAESVPYNILVVLDGARALRRVPGMPMLLSRGAEYGLYAICVDDEERLLPEECSAVAAWDPERPESVLLRGQGLDVVGPVLADQVSPAWTDRVARSLAPVRDVSREDAEDAIPADVRLLDLLDMPDPTAEHVLRSWTLTGGRTTRVPIGLGTGSAQARSSGRPAARPGGGPSLGAFQPYEVDLRTDGPHGLIAGTTGAGKSELLQTLIASLAVANRPDEMTFVLIDYKGGAAFKDCARLPHTVGMVTDLDGHATERALESLAAELRRREEILLDAGAKDIDDYDDLKAQPDRAPGEQAPGGPGGLPPMPRLVLVIDEFAAMVTELPDFVTGLVDIGRRGRSLGVHLILATQRPAGVVTGDIRANTNLRIALRVTDPDESTDVLDSPEAAQISKSTPGRCYVRSGVSSVHAVQSARIGGRRPGGGAAGSPAAAVRPVPWQGLGRPLPVSRDAGEGAADDSTMVTDLAVLVQAIGEAARRAGIARQPSPWLNPLPEQVRLTPRAAAGGSVVDVPPIAFGITDLPAVQSREPLRLDLAKGGHLYLAGAAQSGRSTALRTIAGSVAGACSPYDAHLYAIDCGANALLPLVSLPHCGAVVTRDQLDRCERLLTALLAEVARRQQLLAEAGFSSLAEQRAAVAATDRLPWMILLLDRWEGFLAAFENYDYGRLVDQALRLLREGSAVGLRAVFTGDRSGLGGQVSTVFDRRLILRMGDPNDYGYAGLQEKQVPAAMPPGRALEAVAPGVPLRESQIGLLGDDPSGTAQVSALQEIARACVTRYGRLPRRQRPLHVDELPVRVTYREAMALDPEFLPPSALWTLVGVGGDTLAPVGVDLLNEGPGFAVAGPPRSGRSTTLRTIVHSLLDPAVGGGLVPVVLVTPRRSPLRLLSGRPGVLGLLTADSEPDDLVAAIGDEHRYAVVVDDAELLDETDLDDALRDVLRTARDGEHALVIGGTTEDLGRGYRGFLADTRRSRSGVLLSIDSPDDGEMFGLRLPRNAPLGGPTGRGLLVALGATTQIQVALPPPVSGDRPE